MCGSCDYADVSYARKLIGMLHRKHYDMKYEDKFSTIMIQLKADAKNNPTLQKIAIKLSRAPEWMDQLTGWDINEGFIPKSVYMDEQQEQEYYAREELQQQKELQQLQELQEQLQRQREQKEQQQEEQQQEEQREQREQQKEQKEAGAEAGGAAAGAGAAAAAAGGAEAAAAGGAEAGAAAAGGASSRSTAQ